MRLRQSFVLTLNQLVVLMRKTSLGRALAIVIGLYLVLSPVPTRAQYIIHAGDVLDISVLGVPALHRRSPVDPAGQVSLPVIGSIDAAAQSIPALRATIQGLLIQKNVILDPDVTIEVVEYRPIYVSGDVTKPGAYTYRIGMTVRDAVALAEGYDPMHLRGRNAALVAADARSEYGAASLEIARQWARLARLKSATVAEKVLIVKPPDDVSIDGSAWVEITRLEQQQLEADREDDAREITYLTQMVKQTERQSAALSDEQRESEAALEQQMRNNSRARQLLGQGIVSTARMEDQQRAVTSAQNQLFQVRVRAAQAQKDFEEFTRKLESVGAQKRIKLLQQIQDANSQLAAARLRLKAAAEKLRFTTGLAQNSENPADQPIITIHRQIDGVRQRIVADNGTTLFPGDNIEVTSPPTSSTRSRSSSEEHVGAASPTTGGISENRSPQAPPLAARDLHAEGGKPEARSDRPGRIQAAPNRPYGAPR
jgi:polysaccharide biosynthesis/export protein